VPDSSLARNFSTVDGLVQITYAKCGPEIFGAAPLLLISLTKIAIIRYKFECQDTKPLLPASSSFFRSNATKRIMMHASISLMNRTEDFRPQTLQGEFVASAASRYPGVVLESPTSTAEQESSCNESLLKRTRQLKLEVKRYRQKPQKMRLGLSAPTNSQRTGTSATSTRVQIKLRASEEQLETTMLDNIIIKVKNKKQKIMLLDWKEIRNSERSDSVFNGKCKHYRSKEMSLPVHQPM
jgi:hypothetical protein